jgi:hypothetical protein
MKIERFVYVFVFILLQEKTFLTKKAFLKAFIFRLLLRYLGQSGYFCFH